MHNLNRTFDNMLSTRLYFWQKPTFILTLYIVAAAVACFIKISIDLKPHDIGYISKINNFIIFRNSFFHLIEHSTLYGPFPAEQYDLYKYSPTFALLFAPFAIMPTYAGAILWAIFNAVLLFWAIYQLPIEANKKIIVWWFVFIELITSIQNMQVNPLMAALLIFTFIAFERNQIFWAAFFVVISAYIKVYGVLGAALFLFYPDKTKFVAYSLIWGIVLLCIPLCCISVTELQLQYEGWFSTIQNDHQNRAVDVSVMRMLMGIGHIPFNDHIRLGIQITGIGLFCLKYLKTKHYADFTFRYWSLCAILIWCIVFNHLAESATYIIAVTGVGLWYVMESKNYQTLGLLIAVFVLSSLSPTDIFPKVIRETWIVPYALKALPCFAVWVWIEYHLLTRKAPVVNAP